MDANLDHDAELSEDFLEFCEQNDKPVESFGRLKTDLYLRSLGLTRKPVPEIDEQFVIEDLRASLGNLWKAG